jgi:hypothetical protein
VVQPRKADQPATQPNQVGERVLAFMSANYITDFDEFAEGVVGIPASTFRHWLFNHKIEPQALPVGPMLLCADALGTNPEYLTCMSDDPRPGVMLSYDEGVLLQMYRDIALPRARAELIARAEELMAAHPMPPNTASPFTRAPIRRQKPPANEV